jgi:hypothetical protein
MIQTEKTVMVAMLRANGSPDPAVFASGKIQMEPAVRMMPAFKLNVMISSRIIAARKIGN